MGDGMWARIASALLRQRNYLALLRFLLLSLIAWTNRLLMTVEDFIFPWLSDTPVDKIVFVLGHQRSATTNIQDTLLDIDAMKGSTVYDCLFPSLILKVMMTPLKLLLNIIVETSYDTPNHRVGLNESLEEHLWLLHLFTGEAIPSALYSSLATDRSIVEECMKVTDAHLNFIKRCLKRSRYWNGTSELYVAKPLLFTLCVPKLMMHFPKAKIILCVRDPLDIMKSYAEFLGALTGSKLESKEFQERMHCLLRWYSAPVLRTLATEIKGIGETTKDRMVVNFATWKRDPGKELLRICKWLDLSSNLPMKTCKQKETHRSSKGGTKTESKFFISQEDITKEIGPETYKFLCEAAEGRK